MISHVASWMALTGLTFFNADPVDLLASADGLAVTLSSVTAPIADTLRRRRGRPRKFAAPSRAVTLTLPETVLEALAAVHPDLSRAVAQLVKRRNPVNGRPPADLAVFDRSAVITVRPTASLKRRMGIDLVPLPDGRALISFDHVKTIADVELTVYDALADPDLPAGDRKVFEAIGAILTEARRSKDVTLIRKSIIVLESPRKTRAAKGKSQKLERHGTTR